MEAGVFHPVIAAAAFSFMTLGATAAFRFGSISNRLNMWGLIAALWLHYVLGGSDGLICGLGGCLMALALLLPAYAVGLFAGGDLKFAAATGAFVGWRLLCVGLAGGLFLGLLCGLGLLLFHGPAVGSCRRLVAELSSALTADGPPRLHLVPSRLHAFPYAVVLALGLSGALAAELLL